MNKYFNYYSLVWIISLVVFNLIVFLVRPIIPGYTILYDLRFWALWGCVIAAFGGHLACAYIAMRTKDKTKFFYNIPIIRVSYIGLVVTTISAIVCMLIPNLPAWIGIIICVVVLAITAISVIKAVAASDIVEDVDVKVKGQTLFVKSLTTDADSLILRAGTPEVKNLCKKVYEAVRYSDPMSNEALSGIESQITLKFNEFSKAVTEGSDNIGSLADELVVLIGDRNKKCKVLK